MKRILVSCALMAGIMSVSSIALAWEFSMKGETLWRYRYITRTGNNDIFGNADLPQVSLGVNHIKTWPTPSTNNELPVPTNAHSLTGQIIGVLAGEPGFGSDANLTDYRATIYPKITINKAITLDGSINLTSLGIHSSGRPFANEDMIANTAGVAGTAGGGYYNSLWVPISNRPAGANVPNTFVTVQWWKLAFRTPFLDFSIGMKDSPTGAGLWKTGGRSASTSFTVTANYGPFKIYTAPYFGRTDSNWNQWARDSLDRRNPWRKDDDRNYFGAAQLGIGYSNGPLVFDFSSTAYTYSASSRMYAARNATTGAPGAIPATPARPDPDLCIYDLDMAMKYFDGRFFANGEATLFWQYASGRGSATENGLMEELDVDERAWMYGVELGVVSGPAKITASYVRSTGDDPSTRKDSEEIRKCNRGANPDFMAPWGYLMYYTYGTGSSFDPDGSGQPTNFQHVGLRLDYAVASNLNLFGVGSYSWRDQTNAFRLAGNWLNTIQRFTNDNTGVFSTNANVMAVPDHARDIGWEVDFGANWKMLEGLTWNNTFAYWSPGTWWSYAYPNTANLYRLTAPGVAPTSNFAVTSVNVGRKIDPLFAIRTELVADF